MSYLSAPLRFCLLLFPILSVLLAATSVSAEDKLALTFELPPTHIAPESLVRYQESLPPITPVEIAAPETVSNVVDLGEVMESEVVEPQPSEREELALQFAQSDIAMPVASSQPQDEKVGTVAAAFTLERAAEDVLAAAPETEPAWVGSGGVVKSLQQRLSHRSKDEPTINTANILEADILEDWIYDGGSDSLVARTVGSAEGTRQSDGRKTTAYYGHTDPGNGVWNLGTFSYQHEAVSPEDADEKQLRRLQRQEVQLKAKATQWNVPMSMEVRLNGLDLANQAPLAALDKGGYIERLAEAYEEGKSGEDAIVWARTHAYFDPDKQDWDAPGLGNNRYSIQRDQERRMAAIDQALQAYKSENVEQIAALQKVTIASVGGASALENHLDPTPPVLAQEVLAKEVLAKEVSGQAESSDIVEFSLELVSANEQATLQRDNSANAPDLPIPATQPVEADALASNVVAPNDSLTFENDLIALGEWDGHYEAVASETDDLVETAAIELSDDRVSVRAGEQSQTVLADETLEINAEDAIAPSEPSKTQSRLNRLLEGIKPREQAEIKDSKLPAIDQELSAPPRDELALPAPVSAQSTAEKKAFIRTEDSIVRSK